MSIINNSDCMKMQTTLHDVDFVRNAYIIILVAKLLVEFYGGSNSNWSGCDTGY